MNHGPTKTQRIFVLSVLVSLWFSQILLASPGEDSYQRAVAAFQQGHFEEVLSSLAALPAQEAERPAPYNLRALALMELRRYDEALLASKLAQRLDPDNVNYIYNAGIVYLAKHDFPGAENTFRLGIQRFPQSSRLYEGWGEALFAVRRFIEAELKFRKAAELNPTNASAQVALAKLFHAIGDGEHLGAPASKAVQLDPENYLACYYYGKYLLEYQSQSAEGRDYIRRSITLSPHFVDGLIAWGTILSDDGRWGEAAQAYEQGLLGDPRDSRLYYRLFTAYRKLGRLDKSEWALEQYNRFVDPATAQTGPATPKPASTDP
jgi:tetratricopeptide (TPR) repeat protein